MLLLNDHQTGAFLGALLTVCRVDGEVNMEEIVALEHAVRELTGAASYDKESLLFSQITPRTLAEALTRDADGPFRAAGTSAPAHVATAFVRAALRVGRADGELNDHEIRSICAFATALGTSSNVLKDLDSKLDEWLAAAE